MAMGAHVRGASARGDHVGGGRVMDDDRSLLDPVAMQRALRYRLTRRNLLRNTGIGVAGFSLASLLAACGEDVGGGGGGASGEAPSPEDIFTGEPGPTLNFANWPFYL